MMPVKVAVITTARSDYGPLYWLIHDLFEDRRFAPAVVVAGSHLDEAHGFTVREIERDGWPIFARITLADKAAACVATFASYEALPAFSNFFHSYEADIAVLCGDRYELLAAATAAVLTRTPIAHLYGGDITEGAFDDSVRHALTKLAHLHFPGSARSAGRILQMGEERWRVHAVGDPALDHFVRGSRASPEELECQLGFVPDSSTLLVTFHPPTLQLEDLTRQLSELASALNNYPGSVVITGPAPDPGADVIRRELQELSRVRPRTVFVESLGSRHYRGLMHLVGAMVGNSSSGLLEAPLVPLPVVNIGDRQKGRDRQENVIDARPDRESITRSIEEALKPNFRQTMRIGTLSDGHAARRIANVL